MIIETYKINGWEDEETGILLYENDDWILVKHIPIDYQIDGYKIYCKKWIDARKSGLKEKQIKHVLKLKNVDSAIPSGLKLDNTHSILNQIEKKLGLVEFQDSDSDDLFYAKNINIHGDEFSIDMVDSKGVLEKCYDYRFSFNEIRSIAFKSDYFESIVLLISNPFEDT
ncbi:MAG: hypothetical protein COA33_010340 [Fluviicola sp.]|nr:hypothetical protein [Fluviicola sp.]